MPDIATMERLGWGDPNSSTFARDNIVHLARHGIDLTVNKTPKPLFVAMLDALVYEKGRAWLTVKRDDWGYANRNIRGSTSKSYHAWGLAIDINAADNPQTSGAMHTTMPADAGWLAGAFEMEWGGDFHSSKDPMHYEVHGSRDDIGARVHYLHSTLREGAGPSMPVGVLQKALDTVHGYKLVADSRFGAKTKAALVDFQKHAHMRATGVCDTAVWHALGFDQS